MSLCLLLYCILLSVCCHSVAAEEEPMCTKFMYDKQMIETMVRMEVKMEQWDKEMKEFEEHQKEKLDEVVRAQNGKLESLIADFNNVRDDVRNKTADMEIVADDGREKMNLEFHKQNGKLEKLIADFNEIRDDVRNKTAKMEIVAENIKDRPKVAFNAYTTTSGSYPENKVMIFPTVLLNEGGGYNKNTGIFTAPISGLYQFHAHICKPNKKAMVASIVHGGTTLATTTKSETDEYSCSSVSAPALVNEGENVFIKSSYSGSMLYAASNYWWPSFTGFLVNE